MAENVRLQQRTGWNPSGKPGDGYSGPTALLSGGYTRAFRLAKGTGIYHKAACSWYLGSRVRDHLSCHSRHSSGTCQRPQPHTTCHSCLFKSLRKNQERGIRGYFLWIQLQFEKVLGDGWWGWLYNNVSVLVASEWYTQTWLQWEILCLCHIYFCESCSVVSHSLRPHGLYSPWNFPG